jgi:hypothetical protein
MSRQTMKALPFAMTIADDGAPPPSYDAALASPAVAVAVESKSVGGAAVVVAKPATPDASSFPMHSAPSSQFIGAGATSFQHAPAGPYIPPSRPMWQSNIPTGGGGGAYFDIDVQYGDAGQVVRYQQAQNTRLAPVAPPAQYLPGMMPAGPPVVQQQGFFPPAPSFGPAPVAPGFAPPPGAGYVSSAPMVVGQAAPMYAPMMAPAPSGPAVVYAAPGASFPSAVPQRQVQYAFQPTPASPLRGKIDCKQVRLHASQLPSWALA